MEVLTGSAVTVSNSSLQQTLSARVLLYISLHQPCHPLHLRHQVVGWFAGSNDQEILERLGAIVDWFEERGDIYVAHRGLLYCTPPHAVGDLTSPALTKLQLVGNPGLDNELSTWAVQHSCTLTQDTVDNGTGVVRTLHLAPALDRHAVGPALQHLGCSVVSPESLLEHLETVWDHDYPAPSCFAPRPALGGRWEQYTPLHPVNYQGGRWLAIDGWEQAGLVRWSPSANDGNDWMKRYFLHEGDGNVVEISREAALWWVYKHDEENDRSAPWRYSRKEQFLRISERLPLPVHKLLLILSHAAMRKEEPFVRAYAIAPDHLDWVRRVAQDHLGVSLKEN